MAYVTVPGFGGIASGMRNLTAEAPAERIDWNARRPSVTAGPAIGGRLTQWIHGARSGGPRALQGFGEDIPTIWSPPDFLNPSGSTDVPMAPLDYNANLQPVASETAAGAAAYAAKTSIWNRIGSAVINAATATVKTTVAAPVGAAKPAATSSSGTTYMLLGLAVVAGLMLMPKRGR